MPGGSNCDPACIKIILNGGLVAINAKHLAAITANAGVHDAANDLAAAAETMVATYDFLVSRDAMTRTGKADWSGCDQAATLVGWIAGNADGAQAVATMNEWREAFVAHTLAMVSGGTS